LAEVQSVVTTLEELVTATGLAPADLAARLLELELAGFVHQVAEGYIRRPFSRSW
jgi:predicted Rossmann fold nucleotide-binding protein DprA/Smf involved in DNA uptake